MDSNQIFVVYGGKSYLANIICQFYLFDSTYCIYYITFNDNLYYIYNSKLLNGKFVAFDDENEKIMIDNITKIIINSTKAEDV